MSEERKNKDSTIFLACFAGKITMWHDFDTSTIPPGLFKICGNYKN